MKKSLIAVLCGVAFLMFTTAASAGPMLQFRLAADKPSEGAEKMIRETLRNGEKVSEVYYVQKEVLLDETNLKSAEAATDARGHNQINLTFNEAGAKKFAEVTRQNVQKQLAILIDGKICQAPRILSEITHGTATISGDFSKDEVKDLVKKLNEAAKKK